MKRQATRNTEDTSKSLEVMRRLKQGLALEIHRIEELVFFIMSFTFACLFANKGGNYFACGVRETFL